MPPLTTVRQDFIEVGQPEPAPLVRTIEAGERIASGSLRGAGADRAREHAVSRPTR